MNKTYAVQFMAQMIIEVEADSSEEAVEIIAKEFAAKNARDPLDTTTITLNNSPAKVRTTVLRKEETNNMTAWEV